MRHAKSSWDNVMLPDFDRPLNDRGKEDAPQMAGRINDKQISIDLFISSPAKRAKKTAKIFMDIFYADKKDLILVPNLYEASVIDFYNTLEMVDDKHNNVALFSHNPGITEFANSLTEHKIDNIPTCGVFAISTQIKKWREFRLADKALLFFDYPKASGEAVD